ncbi:hypothetical protein BGZ88_012436 [Linnemannia elongata]|nr:hypothetical protein BGZ88_012436 [Linnemannia elongata]
MTPHQRFRQGDKAVSIAVRIDKTTGEYYSRITDIQTFFPDASLFNLDGVFLNYLEDEYDQVYDPARIAHYPNDIIDVIVTDPVQIPISPPVTLSGLLLSQANSEHSNLITSMGPSTNSIDLKMTNLSLRPLPSATSTTLTQTLLDAPLPYSSPSSSSTSNVVTLQTTSIARPMAILSTMAMDITQLQQQIERSTDQQSAYHQQLLTQLVQMVGQMNEMLQEQAASKAREEQMLQEQAESKIREEQMLKKQQETIDRLIVNQQRVDALLLQNYELHEYPIPRLFVVLPDSFNDWDPRNFLMERFRLFFLCSAVMTVVQFFDQYGPYVLGMLRILQHCLAVAAMAAPVAAMADSGLKDVMDGVKSISESTINAVDMSINILEIKLGDGDVADNLATTAFYGQEGATMSENLAALEGADLRRLDTFLRNNDKDKILGNLYRITTEQGHVKWVCFEHYQEKYRATALASFVQSVETGGGVYDPYLGQVTINLKSGTTSKDFFRRLVTQAPAVQSLDVTLDWDFRSADLVTLVDMVAKSNVKVVNLDLQDDHGSNATIASLRPGKGRYHSLLGLLSNTKICSLRFSNLYLLGTRTSNLPSSFSAPWLQSFCFYGRINEEDRNRLTDIISHCSQLVDLKLVTEVWCSMGLSLEKALFSLKRLRRLHLSGWELFHDQGNASDPRPMNEIVYYTDLENVRGLTKTIQKSGPVLEVLVLYGYIGTSVDIGPENPPRISPLGEREVALTEPLSFSHLSALTHLDISTLLARLSLQYLSTVLPRLNLVHFGCNASSHGLLQHCNFASLKSLSMVDANDTDLKLLLDTKGDGTARATWDGLEQLSIRVVAWYIKMPAPFLQSAQLTRLYLDSLADIPLTAAFEAVNLSKLQEISICNSWYYPIAEHALAKRINEFTESLVVRLDERSSLQYFERGGKPRTDAGSSETLPRHRVINMRNMSSRDHHYRFLQHVLPVYCY